MCLVILFKFFLIFFLGITSIFFYWLQDHELLNYGLLFDRSIGLAEKTVGGKVKGTVYVMDHGYSEESDSMVDLESGEKTSEDDGIEDLDVVGKNAKKMLGSPRSGCNGFGGSGRDIDGLGSSNNVLQSGDVEGKTAGMVEMKMAKEKRRIRSFKKPPKPPRPPNSPSLDVADMKLVREIYELARLRRARIERRKEIKKRRAGKASSSNANLIALVITTLFCFVIIFQGILGSRV
ncbi:uncharacterized protein LOC122319236 isoform X3 [Carya illinoinensis]|nr:uncharacterized protein LOC122319236 isoform X3 [Carya illinoinensis]XP_042993146.1 uncharacterized protein LOC122319236 isoform X3 [Carya illinoinensis]